MGGAGLHKASRRQPLPSPKARMSPGAHPRQEQSSVVSDRPQQPCHRRPGSQGTLESPRLTNFLRGAYPRQDDHGEHHRGSAYKLTTTPFPSGGLLSSPPSPPSLPCHPPTPCSQRLSCYLSAGKSTNVSSCLEYARVCLEEIHSSPGIMLQKCQKRRPEGFHFTSK